MLLTEDEWGRTHTAENVVLGDGEAGDLSLTVERDGKKYTLRGRVREATLVNVKSYRDIDSQYCINSAKTFQDNSRYFFEFVPDEESGFFCKWQIKKEPNVKVTW